MCSVALDGIADMVYLDWKKNVLNSPDNQLSALVETFRASDRQVVHLDRHVWEPLEQPLPKLEDLETTLAICRAGIELLQQWYRCWQMLGEIDVLTSNPVLLIDDDWLGSNGAGTPPHIYVCMAKNEKSFAPVAHEEAEFRTSTGDSRLDALLPGGHRLQRVPGAFTDEPGAWLVSFDGAIQCAAQR